MKILFFILLLQVILFGARILKMIDWPWGWVTAPLWLTILLAIGLVWLLNWIVEHLGEPLEADDD